RIKLALETSYHGGSGNSTVNSPDPNLYVRVCSDTNNEDNINSSATPLQISQQQHVTVDSDVDTDNALGEEAKLFIANNNTIKHKYICK
ncbi:10777_t:CDS:2, partial [Dentiscutata heterogama]